MKIEYALHSCNENPYYLDFWEVVSKSWLKIGVTPVLVIISDRDERIEENGTIVIYMKKLPQFTEVFQSMVSRIWAWNLVDGNCIISDIDMMILSGKYFTENAEIFDEETLVSYSSDAKERFGQIASCYMLANSKLMKPIIGHDNWQDFAKELADNTGQGWGAEQWWFEEATKKAPKVAHLKRGFNSAGIAHRRLDRISWNYRDEDVKAGVYYDAHLLRPYSEHKQAIDHLFSLI